MNPEGIVFDGTNFVDIATWCTQRVGPDAFHYSWRGAFGWHVTVTTQYGHELLHPGDGVLYHGDGLLSVVRRPRDLQPLRSRHQQ